MEGQDEEKKDREEG
ncbi:hypothetical protein Tco_1433188, partial [Tanacetum coccineum]